VFANSSKRARQSTQRPASSKRLAEHARDDSGFTLIELLVVVLIVAVLAAIAIPSFLNQQGKAQDAQAKELVRTAQTTAETIAAGGEGSYQQVSREELHNLEPTIPILARNSEAYLSAATGGPREYSVTATATNGDELTISRSATGEVTRHCASPVKKTGCSGGASSSW
jgi:type IV pilus assembly protein PilA